MHRFIPVAKKASSTILVETSTLSVVYDERKKELFEGKEMQLESEESTGEWISPLQRLAYV